MEHEKDIHMKKKSEIDNKDIVLYSLYILGGWQKRVHTEDIALKCFNLARSKFSWIKYPQFPDIAPARFALEAAMKPINGGLVNGVSERRKRKISGWMLTAEGIKWIEANKKRIEKSLGEHTPAGDRLPSERKLKELYKSQAFKKFSEYGDQADISHAEFAESVVCTVNTKPAILNDRLNQLLSISKELGRDEVKDYVNFCLKKFDSILSQDGG
jgi:hypothetical protein